MLRKNGTAWGHLPLVRQISALLVFQQRGPLLKTMLVAKFSSKSAQDQGFWFFTTQPPIASRTRDNPTMQSASSLFTGSCLLIKQSEKRLSDLQPSAPRLQMILFCHLVYFLIFVGPIGGEQGKGFKQL